MKGHIISADALHTQQTFCTTVDANQGFYLLIAKGNQSTLREDLALFFSEPPLDCCDWRIARSCTKGHGRLEVRELVATTELNDFLAQSWTGVAQVFRLVRTVREQGRTRQEVVSGLTNLSPAQASAEQLLAWVREHWAIENRLHWRRDVTLQEDHCQVRTGAAPRVLAVLNSFLLGLLDFLGVGNVPKQMRLFDAHPLQAVRLLLRSHRWGSGGGLSQAYARPSWQIANGVSNLNANGRRGLPDISAAAYALPVYFGGQWGVVGGTSAAAPIWAAGMALVNEGMIRQLSRFAYSPRLFYQEARASGGMRPFYDVTHGDNLYYPATPGWDFASGLGTPNLADFYSVLSRTG